MAMRAFEYWVIQYVANLEQGVAANIGIVMIEIGSESTGFADVRLASDWRHVKLLNPEVDPGDFYELANSIRSQIRSTARVCSSGGTEMTERSWILQAFQNLFSNSISVGGPKALMTQDPEKTLKDQVAIHCKLPVARRDPDRGGVLRIKKNIKSAFARYDIGPTYLKPNFKIASYVQSADPSPIHFKYEVEMGSAQDLAGIPTTFKKVYRLMHAVNLKHGVDAARTLGYAWPEIREGMERERKIYGHLTAVIEDAVDPERKNLEFATRHFAEHGVELRHVYQLDDMALRARKELTL